MTRHLSKRRRIANGNAPHARLARGVLASIDSAAAALGRAGCTANTFTYAALALAVASGLACAFGALHLGGALLLASGLGDVLDGAVARATKTETRVGALLDSTLDRVADAAPLIGMIVFLSDVRGLAALPALAIVGSFLVSYVRARAEALGAELPPLWMRRPERILLTTGALLFQGISIGPVAVTLVLIAILAAVSFAAAIAAVATAAAILRAHDAASRA